MVMHCFLLNLADLYSEIVFLLFWQEKAKQLLYFWRICDHRIVIFFLNKMSLYRKAYLGNSFTDCVIVWLSLTWLTSMFKDENN